MPGLGSNDPKIHAESLSTSVQVLWGMVRSVDTESQKMQVEILTGGSPVIREIAINNMITNMGFGVRLMPIPNMTTIMIYKDTGGGFHHIGYYLQNMKQLTSDPSGSRQNDSAILLQRNMEPGEVQMIGFMGNEILLANDGSVLLKNQFGAYVRLENFSSTLEGSFANLRFEMDDVTMRAGNVRRSTSESSEEENIYIVDDAIKPEHEVEDGDTTLQMKEFSVDVGVDMADPTAEPSIGKMVLAQRMINNDGTEDATSGRGIQFKLQMQNGGGIAIDENGSFFIVDRLGGDATRFERSTTTTQGDKTFRVGNNFISINGDNGVTVAADGGATLEVRKDGNISIKSSDGRYINFDSQGGNISFPGSTLNITAENLNLAFKKLSMGSTGGDSIMAVRRFSAVYDSHVHLGPAGFPAIQISALLTNPALNPSVPGITVSVGG